MPNQVRVGVGVTGAKGAASEVDSLRDKFANLQKQSAKGIVSGVAAGVTVKALGLVGNAIGDVTGFLGDSVHAYQNAEESQARLTQSLRENVKGWTGNADALKGAITDSEKFGFTNTETADSLALLVGATHNAAKATQMLAVAQDYARFKNVDLLQAATDLTKVEGGSTRALKALGINLHSGATEAERMAAVMKVVGGQAEAYAQTDLGKLAAANEKVNEAQVKFGKGLSRIEADVLPAAADAVSALADQIDALQTAFDSNASPAQKAEADIQALRTGIAGNLPGMKQFLDAMQQQADAMAAAEAATEADRKAVIDHRQSEYEVAKAVVDANQALADQGTTMQLAAQIGDDAFASIAKAADDAASSIRGYRDAVTSSFKAVQDATLAASDTQLAIDKKLDELTALDKQYMVTTHVVTGAQKGEWALRRKIITEEIAKEEAILSKATSTSIQKDKARLAVDKLNMELARLGDVPTTSTKHFTARELDEYRRMRVDILAELTGLKLQAAMVGDDMHRELALQALLTSKDMAKGLTSKDELIRASYVSLKDHILSELNQIAKAGGPAARKAAAAILAGLGSVGRLAGGVGVQFTLSTGKGGVQKLAEGGIVKAKPGGTLALLAEAGHDEAVVPLSGPNAPRSRVSSAFSGAMGTTAAASQTVNIAVNVNLPNAYGMTPGQGEAVGRVLAPIIATEMRRRRLIAASA